MAESIDSLFIESNIERLNSIEDKKEDEYIMFTPYDWRIVSIVKKVRKYITQIVKAA